MLIDANLVLYSTDTASGFHLPATDGRGWARTSDLSRVRRALSH